MGTEANITSKEMFSVQPNLKTAEVGVRGGGVGASYTTEQTNKSAVVTKIISVLLV